LWTLGQGRKLAVIAGVIVFGAMLEMLQHYTYGNAYEWIDVGDDSLGTAFGALAAPAFNVLIRRAGR
jgi:hypothetical protein